MARRIRNLILILGDQLDAAASVLREADRGRDALWLAEVAGESTKVWSHKVRIAFFLSAMRHFAATQREAGHKVFYQTLDEPGAAQTLGAALARTLEQVRPEKVLFFQPGEWDVREEIRNTVTQAGVAFEECEDSHFLCSQADFARHVAGRSQLRMEFFYREMRRRHGVLMEGDAPVGGAWNFDAENRSSFGKDGPGFVPPPKAFPPDAITSAVLQLVNTRFKDHPGDLTAFDWPVTREAALTALGDFVMHRLPEFGQYQDAMWSGDPWLFHSRVSAALNVKLLHPQEVIAAAESAWRDGRAPLPAVEGFIRQILGWREYVRGVYWHLMPEYRTRNVLGAGEPLPAFYWTGETEFNCLRHVLGQTLKLGYAHHIQRLMVTGLFALLLGVRPKEIHEWYLAVYLDAVEWVELPNTLGMSQYADGGVMASKPYIATGKYIQRMSNYCAGCRFDPAQHSGERACPFTTLYWDFLLRHEARLCRNPRMSLQVKNLARLKPKERAGIAAQAKQLRATLAASAPHGHG
jgi:deoxyribodipyrimidine photolyase-related protein